MVNKRVGSMRRDNERRGGSMTKQRPERHSTKEYVARINAARALTPDDLERVLEEKYKLRDVQQTEPDRQCLTNSEIWEIWKETGFHPKGGTREATASQRTVEG